MTVDARKVILVVASVLCPPLAIFLVDGCSVQLLIGCLLALAGHIPGMLFALYVVHRHFNPPEGYLDLEQQPRITVQDDDEQTLGQPFAEGSSDGQSAAAADDATAPPPPAYETVLGDHKIQY